MINSKWARANSLVVRTKRPVRVATARLRRLFMLLPEDRSRVEDLRKRAAALGRVLNKSEAVRLALLGSRAIKDADLSSALEELPRLRPGRHS